MDELEIDLTPKGLGPWSISKLKMLQKCPFQFYLKYILKQKPEITPPISEVTEMGKAAHKILELSITGKSIEDSFRLVKEEYEDILRPDIWQEKMETLEFNVTSFMERMDKFQKAYKVKRFLPELRIGVDHNWEPTGFFAKDVYWRGVIDLVIQLENQDIIILDHKLGPPAEMGLKNFQDQLSSYKVLYNYGIQKVTGAKSGIHFVKAGEILLDDYTSNKDIEGSLRPRMEFYTQGAIDRLQELGWFKHIRANQCKWCDFNEECKAGQLKGQELSTKKYFQIVAV